MVICLVIATEKHFNQWQPEAWQATVTCNTVFSSNLSATGPRLHQSGVRTQAPVAIRPIMALYKHSLGQCSGYRQSSRNFVRHRNVVRNTILLIISVKKAAALIPPWLLTINCLDKVSDLFKVRFTRIVECHLCVDISRYQYQILYWHEIEEWGNSSAYWGKVYKTTSA